MKTPTQRRIKTVAFGLVPIVLLAGAATLDHVPGTDISLAVPYAAEGPGPTVNTLGQIDDVEVVQIETDSNSPVEVDDPAGNLNMTTVSVRTGMTLAQVMSRWITTDDTIVPIEVIFPKGSTEEEVQQHNEFAFNQAESAATVVAMNYLNLPVHTEVAGMLDDSAAAGILQEGDVLTEVGGTPVSKPQEAQDAVRKKKPGDKLTLAWERNGKPEKATVTLGENPDHEGEPLLGIWMTTKSDAGIDVKYNLEDIGGPSAGMMFTLAVIDKLSPGDLTGNHFVAGTGTINEDGTVGGIGGIVHKVRAARDAGAELFLAPEDNCSQAVSRDTKDMVVASVRNIDDAIKAMEDFSAGKPVTQCER